MLDSSLKKKDHSSVSEPIVSNFQKPDAKTPIGTIYHRRVQYFIENTILRRKVVIYSMCGSYCGYIRYNCPVHNQKMRDMQEAEPDVELTLDLDA